MRACGGVGGGDTTVYRNHYNHRFDGIRYAYEVGWESLTTDSQIHALLGFIETKDMHTEANDQTSKDMHVCIRVRPHPLSHPPTCRLTFRKDNGSFSTDTVIAAFSELENLVI